MQPLSEAPDTAWRHVVGVLTDIDDTLTTDGAITADALAALQRLARAGLSCIAITGRPVGWSEPFAVAWPLAAIVAENGAVALRRQSAGFSSERSRLSARSGHSLLQKSYFQDAATRMANALRLQQVAQRVLREVPGAMLSKDSIGRETDIAIDHSEFSHLPPNAIAQVVRIMQSEGMNATVSSIHINGWFGAHDKLVGARWIVRELFGRDLDTEIERWVYVGDSTNDQLMFEHFPLSVGVANVRRFEAELAHKPRYVTQGERGAGFAELVQAVLAENSVK